MKRYLNAVIAVALTGALFIGGLSSCGDKEEAKKKTDKKEKTESKAAASADGVYIPLPNVRYVDTDTLLLHYNLAKDYQDEVLRMQQNIETTQKQRAQAIQKLANEIQKKAQNNQYTEATYNADMNKLSQMQASAEAELSRMQLNAANQAAQMEQVVQDSIRNYVKRYNSSYGYDAILLTASALYVDPKLDITSEIVEGLNRAYNKK